MDKIIKGKTNINITIDKSLLAKLKQTANENDDSLSKTINRIVKKYYLGGK